MQHSHILVQIDWKLVDAAIAFYLFRRTRIMLVKLWGDDLAAERCLTVSYHWLHAGQGRHSISALRLRQCVVLLRRYDLV